MKIERPKRVTRRYVQTLIAPPADVFPLLCPVREAEWAPGWDPRLVLTESGVAEPDCVFVTADTPHDAIWFVTRHEPAEGFVEMVKITPALTACRLAIRLRRAGQGSEAVVTYSHTSLGPAGDTFVDAFTEAQYAGMMQAWESHLNAYLRARPLPTE